MSQVIKAARTPPRAGTVVAALTLTLDVTAVRAIRELERNGVPAILLKGRAIADWLYDNDIRRYRDVDLLVPPDDRNRAMAVLAGLGFHHWLTGASPIEYGRNEVDLGHPSGLWIDLHHGLIGCRAAPSAAWAVLSQHTILMIVAGQPVPVLDIGARTMHLALHAAQNGLRDQGAIADLRRGLQQVPVRTWRDALEVARSIGADDAMAAGLWLLPAGRGLAVALGLAPPHDIELRLRTSRATPQALSIQNLIATPGTAARLRFVARKLWPTAAYMSSRPPPGDPDQRLLVRRLRRLAGLPVVTVRAAGWWLRVRSTVRF